MVVNSCDEYGISAITNLGRFRYTGQAWIPEYGMYHYKARIYSPTLGQFVWNAGTTLTLLFHEGGNIIEQRDGNNGGTTHISAVLLQSFGLLHCQSGCRQEQVKNYNGWCFVAMSSSLITLILLLDRAYTISYDENHSVMTGYKWFWPPTWRFPNTITFDGIRAVDGAMGPGGTIQGKFMPFDHIRIDGDVTGRYDHIMVSPNFLDVEGCRELMRAIYAKRPEVVDADVVTFMNSDKNW
jgi:hypothetical protein